MKIGIFDSGIGGLITAHAIIQALPTYDYAYLGDTARIPYGTRSQETVYNFTRDGVKWLFKQDCNLIILACNTASAEALRRLQMTWLPHHYPDRRVLGVLIPMAEAAVDVSEHGRVGVLATRSTVSSKAFDRELTKLRPDVQVVSQAAPLLVPLIENDGVKWADPILASYLSSFEGQDLDSLILGCTHYAYLKPQITQQLPGVSIISQDDVVPPKLKDYLNRHPEIESKLSQTKSRQFFVTDITDSVQSVGAELFSAPLNLEKISL